MATWKHEFIKKQHNKVRCTYCGIEFDATDTPEIIAAYVTEIGRASCRERV